jgi:hypothetical protein
MSSLELKLAQCTVWILESCLSDEFLTSNDKLKWLRKNFDGEFQENDIRIIRQNIVNAVRGSGMSLENWRQRTNELQNTCQAIC